MARTFWMYPVLFNCTPRFVTSGLLWAFLSHLSPLYFFPAYASIVCFLLAESSLYNTKNVISLIVFQPLRSVRRLPLSPAYISYLTVHSLHARKLFLIRNKRIFLYLEMARDENWKSKIYGLLNVIFFYIYHVATNGRFLFRDNEDLSIVCEIVI